MLDLSKPWREYPVLSVDFEGTTPDHATSEPVEVSAVRFENGAVGARFTSLLKPKAPIPDEAIAIHGITNEMVANSPSLAEVSHELSKLSDGAVPLAFNRGYDRTIMHRYLSGEGVSLFDPGQPWLCALAMAWGADGVQPIKGYYKLAACCERRGIRIVGAHRAEADAIASGTLFFSIMGGATPTMAQLLARVGSNEIKRDDEYRAYKQRVTREDRLVWREYAKTAPVAEIARGFNSPMTADEVAQCAAGYADRMLSIEKERWL